MRASSTQPKPYYPITAWCAVNALGRTTNAVLEGLHAGRRGVAECPFPLPMPTVVGAVPGDLKPLAAELSRFDSRLARIAALGAQDIEAQVHAARERYGAQRVAVILGTSTGGLWATEENHWAYRRGEGGVPSFSLEHQHSFNGMADYLAARFELEGPSYTISTACSSSGKAMLAAARLIHRGLIDAAIVGGGDSLCKMTLQGFHGLGILSDKACQPFDKNRQGINIGEGCAFQLIEREGESQVWFLGGGESSDAYHMSSPHPEGRGAREAMERAMAAGGVGIEDIDHINAHGTATLLNDKSEALAISALFGQSVPVTSTKQYTGHLLGGAGGVEASFALDAVTSSFIPATLGCEELDDVGIDVVMSPRETKVRRVLSNSFAFGGNNVSLLLGERP